ncbi:uncharacterized protein LACBIDRAFT_324759 [Laccaria bicolor S238N-H82]|uniref:Predicted protein n=1 Tax=Laccaria bicolor (strain S238N-H82 / ATCC MYA-4686) TaxID=486041 RepID=B0D2Y4_LACBS|nr:uncharacterized protein LACBIDRAFT_324759 [Laccaria bicolor S238N-H82]EDR11177.1 predicted protein [Laccaria bicolor S238N-H82]|eukprot:XP_001878478.1 predicted protein [Laccaria bicolor S238N-H82]
MRLSNGWVFSIVVPLALLHGAPSGAKPSSLADLLFPDKGMAEIEGGKVETCKMFSVRLNGEYRDLARINGKGQLFQLWTKLNKMLHSNAGRQKPKLVQIIGQSPISGVACGSGIHGFRIDGQVSNGRKIVPNVRNAVLHLLFCDPEPEIFEHGECTDNGYGMGCEKHPVTEAQFPDTTKSGQELHGCCICPQKGVTRDLDFYSCNIRADYEARINGKTIEAAVDKIDLRHIRQERAWRRPHLKFHFAPLSAVAM